MRKFILFRENDFIYRKGNNTDWYRDQKAHYDKILAKVSPLQTLLTLDKQLNTRGVIEVLQSQIKIFRGKIKIKVYDTFDDIPFFLTNEIIWDGFSNNEKIGILNSTNPNIKRFVFDLTIRNIFNIKKTRFINDMNLLEAEGIINSGRADEILDELNNYNIDNVFYNGG